MRNPDLLFCISGTLLPLCSRQQFCKHNCLSPPPHSPGCVCFICFFPWHRMCQRTNKNACCSLSAGLLRGDDFTVHKDAFTGCRLCTYAIASSTGVRSRRPVNLCVSHEESALLPVLWNEGARRIHTHWSDSQDTHSESHYLSTLFKMCAFVIVRVCPCVCV